MKTKILSSIFFAALFIVALTSLASAAVTFSDPTSDHPKKALTPYSDVTITLTNPDALPADITLSFENSGFASITAYTVRKSDNTTIFQNGVQTAPLVIPATSSETLTVSVSDVNDNIKFGTSPTATIKAAAGFDNSDTAQLTYYQSFCASGPARFDVLELNGVDVTNDGDSEDSDDENWFPFDPITVDIDVDNDGDEDNNNDDLEDLIVIVGLIDSTGSDVIKEFTFSDSDDEEKEIGDLDGDESESVTFEFLLEEIDESLDGNFDFVVKVFEDGNEDETCVDFTDDFDDNDGFSTQVSLDRETDEEKFVRFNDVIINPTEITCSENVQVSVDVANVGDEKVENLEVILFNQELGINIRETVNEDLDSGEESSVSFDFVIPGNAQNKAYIFQLTSKYEIDDDEFNSDLEETFLVNVIGCGVDNGNGDGSGANLKIDATLKSDAQAGEELVVDVEFTNDGSDDMSIVIDAKEFSSWASGADISERILTLEAGERATVTFTFDVRNTARGAQSFVVEAITNGDTEQQEVRVVFEESSVGDLSDLFEGNGLIWIIAAVNIILIILIILVAVRLSRR